MAIMETKSAKQLKICLYYADYLNLSSFHNVTRQIIET